MQINGLNIGSALSRLASQQEASQKIYSIYITEIRSWQNLVIGGACLFTLHFLSFFFCKVAALLPRCFLAGQA